MPQLTIGGSQRGEGGAGARPRAPAVASAGRGLVAGRAADERHDGRRGHAAARVPGDSPRRSRPSARRRGSAPSSARTGRGRTSTAAPASCRRRSRPTGRCASPAIAPEAEHMRAAAEFIRGEGGLERARVFTHLWLALFGLWSWERVPALPPEIILLPRWVPLNVYDFACWARQTIVALSLVKAHRPVRPLPFDLDELRATPDGRRAARAALRPSASPAAACWLGRLDRLLRAYERRPLAPLRRLALARAERWIVRRQEADGSWGGIQPPWVYSLMALHLAGYPLEHPVMRRGLEGLERFMVEDRDDSRGVGAPAGAEPAPGSVPVAGVGHGAGDDRPQRRRPGRGPSGDRSAPRSGCSARRSPSAATGRCPRPESAARRLGVRVRERQLPRRRRHGRGRAARSRPAPFARPIDGAVARADRRCDRAARALGRGDAELPTAAGARSTPTTRARSCASCRSWTSAR